MSVSVPKRSATIQKDDYLTNGVELFEVVLAASKHISIRNSVTGQFVVLSRTELDAPPWRRPSEAAEPAT